jgi:hypothetical protein
MPALRVVSAFISPPFGGEFEEIRVGQAEPEEV